MLNNKKLGIRLIAILMTLLMTVAIFAGCTDKEAQAKADAAQSQADAANAAAAAANAAAQSAAQAAADLAAQLAAAKAAADSAKAAADSAKAAANAAQSGLNSYISGDNKPVTGNITEQKQKEVTDYINTTVLGELSQLKVKYLTIRYLWYTEANYSRIARMFDDAYIDIYRATTIDGVKGVIAKLTTDVAAVASIVSDAEAIQAQIKAFGDVDTSLFTTQEPAVVKARADFNTWFNVYKSYFTANVVTAATIEEFAYKTFGIATTTLKYAESKIVTLKGYATHVSDEAYAAVTTIWGKTAYSDIKTNSLAIENAYNLYKIFMTANGGDGTLIYKKDTAPDPDRILTGEQFVKQYVLVLYDGWFAQYLAYAKNKVDELPSYFVSFTATPAVANDCERIAVLANASFINLTYSGSFKGTYSLEDAYLQVDGYIKKAMVDMAAVCYNKFSIPAYQTAFAALDANVKIPDKTATGYINSTDSTYKTFNIAFANEYIAAIAAYNAEMAKTTFMTYETFIAKTNIEDIRVFSVNTTSNDVVATYLDAALDLVEAKLDDAEDDLADYCANAAAELAELKAFYDFKRDLCFKISAITSTMDAYNKANVVKLSEARTALGGVAITEAEAATLKTAVTAVATNYRTAVMALKYDSFSAVTYQAKDANGKLLYYSKAAGSTTTNDATITIVGKYPLNVQVDKLVVAKDKVVAMYGEYSDQILKIFADLIRTDVNTYVDKCLTAYNTNYPAGTSDTINLNADINNYVTYLKTIASLSSIGTFNPADFSLENDAIATGLDSASIGLLGYTVESLGNNQYLYHVTDFVGTTTNIADNYTTRFDAKINQYVNLVKSGAGNAYTSLEKVRFLAFAKDDAIVNLGNIKAAVVGTFDTKTGAFTTAPTYAYDYYSSRKVMYLSAVDAVYNKLVAAVKTVTMLDEDVLEAADPYATALAKVNAIIALADDASDGLKASKSKDDFSFKVAYDRYYATRADGTSVYDWSKYNG